MITTITPYSDLRNRASVGGNYDGVVRISINGSYGTGTLLFDGSAVLTAAHLFSKVSSSSIATVIFDTSTGQQTINSTHIEVIPSFDVINYNNDLALVWLSSSAPVSAQRYELYRSSDEIGQTMTMVGYGTPGTGNTGILTTYNGDKLRLTASNQFDADGATLKTALGTQLSWTPTANQLIADYDNGNSAQDALGQLINKPGLGLGQNEGMISTGDSGGPAFINGMIAGIASYTASISLGIIHPDIDTLKNSSFGEIGAWQRVSNYQQWIDQTIRSQYVDAPTKPEQVKTSIIEGNNGTTLNYFLLQVTGVRTDSAQLLSVDYTTRDGTAIAGQDYLATKGTLVLYSNENQAVIPVEIIGDNIYEPNEIFYLDVFNPVGGSFGTDVIKLTAVRTIVNDDIA